jgi:hypothetical protein
MPPLSVPRFFPPVNFKGPEGSAESAYIFLPAGYIFCGWSYISRGDPYIGRELPRASGEAPYIEEADFYRFHPPEKRGADACDISPPRFSLLWSRNDMPDVELYMAPASPEPPAPRIKKQEPEFWLSREGLQSSQQGKEPS